MPRDRPSSRQTTLKRDYSALPTPMDERTIAGYVDEILTTARSGPEAEPYAVLDALQCMLAHQQMHHRPFSGDLDRRIEEWLLSAWRDSQVFVEGAMVLSSYMHAPARLAERMRRAAREATAPAVREQAAAALDELSGAGGHRATPEGSR